MTGPHAKGDKINDRYEIINYLNKGGMQFVYVAKDCILGRKVALKTPINPTAEKRFRRSAIVSSKVNHPYVAKTLDYIVVNKRQYLIEELIDGEDLGKLISKTAKYLDPYIVARILHFLSKGLAASHHVDVVHRDLKPSNVMITGGLDINEIKITDFGIAKMAGQEIDAAIEGGNETISASATVVGALPYMAPEAIMDRTNVNKPADIWSLGAMMYELLTGNKPFGVGLAIVAKITSGELPAVPSFVTSNAQLEPLSSKLIAIIFRCMQKDASLRPTADEIAFECSSLCYPIEKRYIGSINNIMYDSYGFIDQQDGNVFFHLGSVYGEKPKIGEKVMFSRFKGGGADRAHPVVKVIQD